jgi:two-component system chemotaxis sensor kinase CheA
MAAFDRSAFVAKFREEANDLLQRLNESVIALETNPDDLDLVERTLRDAHTLKGSSRMVGLLEISDIAHTLEEVLVQLRGGGFPYAADMSETLFEALDVVVYLVENGGDDPRNAVDVPSLQAKLLALVPETEAEVLEPESACGDAALESDRTGCYADDEYAEGGQDDDRSELADDGGLIPATSGACAYEDQLTTRRQSTIRVSTSHVDELLNLVSETMISQTKAEQRQAELRDIVLESAELWQHWLKLKAALPPVDDGDELHEGASELDSVLGSYRRRLGGFLKSYSDDVSRASAVLGEVQERAMQLRMLPCDTVFQAFPRAVRDLARQSGKHAEVVIEGGDAELDKKVLEEINDPLIHILRNAVDHGIETPEERLALGKPESGTITISARQEGDRIVIVVADDGAGIDPDLVREAAVRKGYVTEGEAEAMSDREALYLIFETGFSTAAIITELSGRGVGMDVVREFIIERLKGSLDIRSERNKGTTLILTLPLTLAIIRALLVRVGKRVFAMPTTSIDETLRVAPDEILRTEGRDVIRRGRRTFPLVRVSDILGIPEDGQLEGAKVPIATVSYSGARFGFIVDGFAGEQQIVIKPLATHLGRVDNIAGVTILGAGDVVPILNVPDLMASARTRVGRRSVHVATAAEDERGPRRVLICEDSFTTRELERSIFETAGYRVETAVDGAAGLALLRGEGGTIDAVVTDVQMPRMNGFELTRAIREDEGLTGTPVVIVTSLERPEEKAEGIDAGADAYITKSVFNQDTLLDTVERLIG